LASTTRGLTELNRGPLLLGSTVHRGEETPELVWRFEFTGHTVKQQCEAALRFSQGLGFEYMLPGDVTGEGVLYKSVIYIRSVRHVCAFGTTEDVQILPPLTVPQILCVIALIISHAA
jgi:hypothetical protein